MTSRVGKLDRDSGFSDSSTVTRIRAANAMLVASRTSRTGVGTGITSKPRMPPTPTAKKTSGCRPTPKYDRYRANFFMTEGSDIWRR